MPTGPRDAPVDDRPAEAIAAAILMAGSVVTIIAASLFARPAHAVPAFAQQTGQPCKACHVGGFGPELTPFGREFKLGGYTLRAHASFPVAVMAIASVTHTAKEQNPPPEHLDRNDNLVLDEAAMFLAGGIGSHFGGFAEVTYEGVDRHFSWDNLDLRAVAPTHLFGTDAILGLTLNNSPTVQDPWNTLPAWGFPFTDTSVSETPAAAPVIDDALAQNVMGLSAYAWIAHSVYVELGGYSSPARGTLDFLGVDPFDPGSIHGFAPYARAAYQAKLAGGTFEIGGSALKAALFPDRDHSSGFTDHYTDLGLDTSWQKDIRTTDKLSINFRYEHEHADLRASCALDLIGDGSSVGCGQYNLAEWRGAVRYTFHDHIGLTLSPFAITGSRNSNVFDGNGLPNSNGLMGQVDYTLWPSSNSPLGSRVNSRIGVQFTAYGKFNGAQHNFDGNGADAGNSNALRVFTWIAF
jgi:hypothetical protein